MKKLLTALVGLTTYVSTSVLAAESDDYSLKDVFKEFGVNVVSQHKFSELSNVSLDVYITSQGIVYYDEANKILFSNTTPMKIEGKQLVNLDRGINNELLESIPNKVVAKAKNEKAKIQVFTDITCGWCQKVHDELHHYLSNGVTVEFILYSREGLDSQASRVMSAISESQDPLMSLAQAFEGRAPIPNPSYNETMKRNHSFAQMFGVSGTPVMFIDGLKIDRYVPYAIAFELLELDKK
ncbi:thioredoxin fold domain-containing protein [Vibrio mediterranei]|uniref:thioredoxin fold domain-containing protein n=1 Tax=Vibrio mediterranei TaxID=689 RepID=UPI004069861E